VTWTLNVLSPPTRITKNERIRETAAAAAAAETDTEAAVVVAVACVCTAAAGDGKIRPTGCSQRGFFCRRDCELWLIKSRFIRTLTSSIFDQLHCSFTLNDGIIRSLIRTTVIVTVKLRDKVAAEIQNVV